MGRPSSSVFSSLRSRWHTPSAWQYSTPHTSCWKKKRASSSAKRPARTMRSKSSPPKKGGREGRRGGRVEGGEKHAARARAETAPRPQPQPKHPNLYLHAPAAYSMTMPRWVPVTKTSRKAMMLGCMRERWLTSSRSTLRSIWGGRGSSMGSVGGKRAGIGRRGAARRSPSCARAGHAAPLASDPSPTLSPRSMNLTATSSPDAVSRASLATPKLPDPMSRI